MSVLGLCPIATNTALHAISDFSPVFALRTTTPRHRPFSSGRISSTTLSHTGSIFGLESARSAMIFDARNSPRRWIIFTDEQKRVRNTASSHAESPPPTTATSLPR